MLQYKWNRIMMNVLDLFEIAESFFNFHHCLFLYVCVCLSVWSTKFRPNSCFDVIAILTKQILTSLAQSLSKL